MTERVAVVTDTTACIPKELVSQYNIEVVPVNFIFGDSVYRDGIDMTSTEFYSRLRVAKKLPTTSSVSPVSYLEAFRHASELASNILCVTLPVKLSGLFNSARVAADMAKETLGKVHIEVIDSGTAAAAQGWVVLAAVRAAQAGADFDEVVTRARDVMKKVHLFAMLDTLTYLVKGGRVPKAAALVNSLLKIKPIFTVVDGEASPVTLARTTKNGIGHLVELMKPLVIPGQPLHVAMMHADAPDKANELKDAISSRFNCTEILTTEFTPVMGVHTGPGLIGVAFYCGE